MELKDFVASDLLLKKFFKKVFLLRIKEGEEVLEPSSYNWFLSLEKIRKYKQKQASVCMLDKHLFDFSSPPS